MTCRVARGSVIAKRGSKKALSVEHEEHIAGLYGGKRSISSGAAVTDAGDMKTFEDLFECKMTGTPGQPPKRVPTLVQTMEKIADEAWEVGRNPAVALRYYVPQSKLADRQGWVDLTVRLTYDDRDRT